MILPCHRRNSSPSPLHRSQLRLTPSNAKSARLLSSDSEFPPSQNELPQQYDDQASADVFAQSASNLSVCLLVALKRDCFSPSKSPMTFSGGGHATTTVGVGHLDSVTNVCSMAIAPFKALRYSLSFPEGENPSAIAEAVRKFAHILAPFSFIFSSSPSFTAAVSFLASAVSFSAIALLLCQRLLLCCSELLRMG